MKSTGNPHLSLILICCAVSCFLLTACYKSVDLKERDGDSPEIPDRPDVPVIEICGNAVVEGSEECDDGNMNECDGCSSQCRWQRAMQTDAFPGARTLGPVPCQQCPFTIEMWFRIDSGGEGMFTLFDLPGFMTVALSTEYYEYVTRDGGGGGVVNPPFEPGSWHHFAMVCSWRGTSWDFFMHLDGRSDFGGFGTSELPHWSCDGPLLVGSVYNSLGWPFPFIPGAVDDLRISNQGLYSVEGSFVPEKYLLVREDTVALWRFNSVEEGRIRDVSGNGYDLVLAEGMLTADGCHGR
jgi:cysteine-rich repeat protein